MEVLIPEQRDQLSRPLGFCDCVAVPGAVKTYRRRPRPLPERSCAGALSAPAPSRRKEGRRIGSFHRRNTQWRYLWLTKKMTI